MNHYQELREALGIPQETSHEDALGIASKMKLMEWDCAYPKELNTDAFDHQWKIWLLYRRERKLAAYKPIGLQAQMAKLAKLGESRAIAAIKHSILQNYQGIYEERQGSAAQNTRSTGTLNTAGRYNLGAGVHGGKRTEAHGQVPPVG